MVYFVLIDDIIDEETFYLASLIFIIMSLKYGIPGKPSVALVTLENTCIGSGFI